MKEAWAVRPEKIPSDQIKGIYEADIVVVGAGYAGTCAAAARSDISTASGRGRMASRRWMWIRL